MKINLKVFFLLMLLVSLVCTPAFSQADEYLVQYKDVFSRYLKVSMVNDFNPIIGQKSNDSGHTLGLSFDYAVSQPEKGAYYEFTLESHLYTEYFGNYYINSEDRDIYPQYFTEISSFNFAYNKYFEDYRAFLDLKTYVGVYNRKKAIPGLALYLQGGSDGKGGYHAFVPYNSGQDNLPSGPQSLLFYLEPGVKKYFVGKVLTQKDNAFVKVHAGAKLGFPTVGMNAFVNMNSELPLLQFRSKKANLIKLTLCYQHEFSLHKDGLLYMPELGVEASLLFVTLGCTSNFYYGKRNVSLVNYIDDERMMRLYIKLNFDEISF